MAGVIDRKQTQYEFLKCLVDVFIYVLTWLAFHGWHKKYVGSALGPLVIQDVYITSPSAIESN